MKQFNTDNLLSYLSSAIDNIELTENDIDDFNKNYILFSNRQNQEEINHCDDNQGEKEV